MTSEAVELAYRGAWRELLKHLEAQPQQVNALSSKGYTPLHQAAWHGASPRVVGALLALGADVSVRTLNRDQTAADIALEKHPGREDLRFLLQPDGRSPAQLLRKLLADRPSLFKAYDGNRVLFDRIVECLDSGDGVRVEADMGEVLHAAIRSVAGEAFFRLGNVKILGSPMDMEASSSLWLETIIPAFIDLSTRARMTPLDPSFVVMSDLFDPMPSQWGFRGDPFLWMEMAHALCHVPIPMDDRAVQRIVLACFMTLTGSEPKHDENLGIERFARGGMSSGMICGETWTTTLIPMLRQRAQWLREAWTPGT